MSAREQFDALFGDRTARAARTSALDGGLRQCTIRSIVWRVFLELLPGQVDEEAWKQATRRNRERYQQLVEELMINPEEDDDTDPMLDNPLMASEETDSKWSQFFEDEEIQKEIMNDVTRTYPDIEFFRRETTQTFLMRVLFIWVKLHPDLGYRQGMNELLAPLALILSREYGEDSIAGGTARPYGDDDPDSIIRFLLDDTYLEHDAFFIFDKVMEAMMPLYITEGGSNTGSALRGQMNALGGRGENVNLSVQRCKDVHKLLEKADPEVYQHIAKKHQIEPQLYILRWLRLIFTREFHIDDVILIWDAILADSSQLRLIDYISVSMIMFIRQNLLDFTDVSQVLARLMKYPPVESIMVIVDKALIIAGGTAGGTCNMQPTMSYGHMPRRAEKPTLPTPLPAAPRNATTSVPKLSAVQEENSSVEAFAETAGPIVNRAVLPVCAEEWVQ